VAAQLDLTEKRLIMGTKKSIFVVDSHTGGEPSRVIIGGLPTIPGRTMAEKKEYLQEKLDSVRLMLMHEPRGHQDMFGAVLLPPTDPEADLGVVFMDSGRYLNMCGHGTIGAVTVAVENGMVPVEEPRTVITLDTPAGLVRASAEVRDGKAVSVTVRNVPSFIFREGVEIELPDIGKVSLDIVFGGSFFALVDSKYLGAPLTSQYKQEICRFGLAVRERVEAEVEVSHPLMPHLNSVDLVEIYGPATEGSGSDARNVVVFGSGQIDRSPCGTGTSAKMASLYFNKRLALHQDFVYEGITGTTFTGRLVGETSVGELPAVVPEITGRAFVTGYCHFIADPEDKVGSGFLI